LPPDAQDRLLDDITELSATGSRFAGDYVTSEGRSESMQQRMRGLTDRWRDHGVDIDMENLTTPPGGQTAPNVADRSGEISPTRKSRSQLSSLF
jgi:O-methyltransferase involved in polyketide biosynthesis